MNAEPLPTAPSRSSISYQVLALSLLLTFIATYHLMSTAENRDRLRFQNQVQRAQGLIEDQQETHVALLLATSGLFAVDESIGPEEFRSFIRRLDLRRKYSGIQGIGFTRRLAPGEIEPLVRAMRRQGVPDFHIWPDEPRSEVHSILFLEPVDRRNQEALGYDMFTDPVRRAAMERARDTGQPAATGKVTLVQDPDQQPGFLLYVPVYRQGRPLATVQDRRSALLGFVYGAFRAGDLLGKILGPGRQLYLAPQVYTGREPTPEGLLYDSPARTPGHRPHFVSTERLDFTGSPWTIVYSTLPAFEATSGRSQAWVVLLLGLTTSGILFLLSRSQGHARRAAERAAHELRRSEEALRESSERYRKASEDLQRDILYRIHAEQRFREEAEITETLHAIGLATAAELDLHKLAQTIVEAATRITGAQFGAFFYHLVGEKGEVFREHALAGDPPEGIEEFLAPRNPDLAGPTFRGDKVVRIDDVLDDSRFGRRLPSEHGLLERGPGGLPVRSYLTTPVISRSGELLGGLFFGHSEPGVFTSRAERILNGIAAQSAVAIDNAWLYEAERRARAESETANQAKDRFMASLSHELRTPLTPVLAVISGLELDSRLPPDALQRLTVIRRNVELEARLIDDLLDLTRINRGKLELKPEVADLREILAHATDACCPQGEPGRERFVVDLPDEDLRLWADAPRLTQVFWNLFKNAIKFSPDGAPIRVRVRCEEGSGQLVIEVSDQGIGIEPDRLPQVFDAFEQGQRRITRQYGGLGLGLAISKTIVELHGGRIAAHSDGPGRGATFTVRLPIGAARLPATAPARPAADPALAPSGAAEASRPLHILLVEDHPDTADAMQTLLSVVGHRVTVAHCAEEALAAASASQVDGHGSDIDLVVSDVGLPDRSGHELMSELKSRYQLRGIALSGYGMDEDVRRSEEAGFERHLTKPVNLQLLQEVIREVAGREVTGQGGSGGWHAP